MNRISTIVISELKQIRFYIILLFVFAYCMLSLVNHYNFRTAIFDLGIFTNSIYQYSHFFNNHHPIGHYSVTNFIGDHFALYTMFLSPLGYLFGSYTMLYVQIAAIVLGGIGIYKIIRLQYPGTFLPEIALFHFFAFYGIFSALSYDYHDNVVAAMIVPWFLYYIELKRFKAAAFTAFLICVGKENMPLWLIFICLGSVILYWKEKKTRTFLLIVASCSLVYAIIIIKLVMPAFVKHGYEGAHFAYSVLGDNPEDLMINLLTKTKYIFTTLFTNVNGNNFYNGIKEETYTCLLLSGALALLLKPEYLIMLIPIFAQKMYNNDMGKWGINGHYSIEFAPIVILAFYSSLHYFKNGNCKIAISLFFCLTCYSTTLVKMFGRTSLWFHEESSNLFSPLHYESEFNKQSVDEIIALIPDTARVSAFNSFGPHLAFRKYIYLFPDINDAEYVLMAQSLTSWPLRGNELQAEIARFKNSSLWELVSEKDGIYLFKKRDFRKNNVMH